MSWGTQRPPATGRRRKWVGCRSPDCQTTPRHTTHHKDLPEHVTITRTQHPLEGKTLAVFGQRRYQDKLHLILILPKGGRALIPKEWTDIEALSQDPSTQDELHTHLGSIRDLLHARAVVDALLSRRSSETGSDDKSVDKENAHLATHAELSRPPHRRNSNVGNAGGATTNLRPRSLGTTDCQGNTHHGGGRS